MTPTQTRRVQRSRQAILDATRQLLVADGDVGSLTVESVAARSGVAKTTIYRHWPSRSALILDACSKLRPKSEITDTGNLKDDLTSLTMNLANRLKTARWATILPSIMDAAERDPELAKLHAQLHTEMTTGLRTVIERAQQPALVPESGRGVFVREPVRRLLAAHQQAAEAIELPQGEAGETEKPSRDQGSEPLAR